MHYMWNSSSRTSRACAASWRPSSAAITEELAITRNASEALQIAQLGIDLKAGDEVVTTEPGLRADARHLGSARPPRQDRGRRRSRSRCRRPTCRSSTDRITRAITPKTKVIHICHITNLTGQLFPVRDIARMARRARHPDHRRRRARVRALPVQGVAISSATTTAVAAQVAARAGRHRVPLRAAREHRRSSGR